ncbi:MAG: ABC transporter substrate-binding protein [Armatimonadota bacterium]|nr:ABC transporter substrate-binding protein [Armatimonadota bacterium]
MQKKRRLNGLSRLALCMLLIALIPVLLSPAYGKEPTKAPYKIGAVFAITGPASPLGTPEKETAQMLEKQINAAGGIDGHPVEIIIRDTKSKETDTVLAVKELIEQGVVAIVGPSQTGESLALLDTVTREKIPLVSCAAGIKIVQPVTPWVFKTAQSDQHAVAKLIDYMKAKGFKTIAIISVSNAFGDSGKQQLEIQCKRAGIKIVAEETFGDKDTDMTAQLTRIKAKKPNAVVCWGTNPGPAIVAKNMKQLGMKMPLLMSHGIANRKFIELAGSAANGVVFPAGRLIVVDEIPNSDPQKPVLLEYRRSFRKMFAHDPDTFGGHAWDAIKLVVRALDKVGPDKAKIRDEIEKTKNFVGISGVFSFSPKEHNGLTKNAFVMVTIKDGKWKLLD